MSKILYIFLLTTALLQHTIADSNQQIAIEKVYGSSGRRFRTKAAATIAHQPYQASTIVPGVVRDSIPVSCQMDNGVMGECVSYYLCGTNKTIETEGIGIIDIRKKNGVCPSYLDNCCQVPDILPEDTPVTLAPTISNEDRSGCGWRNPDGVGFRSTGDVNNETKFGELPWMVAILKLEPVNEKGHNDRKVMIYLGGGSLIHPSVVLTGAYYVSNRTEYLARVGEWDTRTTKEIYPTQNIHIQQVVIHDRFNAGNLHYNVALLFLTKPVDMSKPNVGLACLPREDDFAEPGTRCLASGWGKKEFQKDARYQVILKKVEMPVVEHSVCQTQLRRTRLGRHFQLHSTFMCAGGEAGVDVCKGDGGAPLVCPIPYESGRYVQNGIVAWGIGCGENGIPGVYVDVAKFRNWIDEKVESHGLDIRTYDY